MTRFNLSLLYSNVFDPFSHDEEVALDTLVKISKHKKYNSIETRPFFNKEIQNEFRQLSRDNNWSITFWLTSSMNKNKANLSDIDPTRRTEAVEYVKRLIHLCHQSGAEYVGFGGGPISDNFELSFNSFYRSVIELADFSKQYPKLRLMIEPLDMRAHKKSTIGDLKTTKRLFEALESGGYTERILLCIDTAHFALNGDNLETTIKELAKYSNRLHLANAVLDKNHKDFGDNHLPFGGDGFLNETTAKDILNIAKETKFKDENIFLTAEVRGINPNTVWDLENECYDFLMTASL